MNGPSIELPGWLAALDDEDRMFLRRFLFASGSLKDVAAEYGVSYPTVRARLDRVIAKSRAGDAAESSGPFERKLRVLVAEGSIAPALAKDLIATHRAALKRGDQS